MKRFSLVMCLVLALSFVFVASAFANFGPHGGYATDTDACAGCHRAHTSFSQVKFTPKDPGAGAQPYALLVGTGTQMQEFCYACHGNLAPGASTNVQGGKFDGAASTANGAAANPGAGSLYVTDSKDGAPLNGGGFTQAAKNWDWDTGNVGSAVFTNITSSHSMEKTGIIWGAGDGSSVPTYLTCTSCHDPHGSSNYRLLKDEVNGNPVGGYDVNGAPNGAYVWGAEPSYPVASDKGWLKGPAGKAQMDLYVPNYTDGANIKATGGTKNLSAWCSGCHTGYDNVASAKDYGTYENLAVGVSNPTRHRHPVNITVGSGDAALQIKAQANADATGLDKRLPLESAGTVASVRDNYIGCLTCHLAHGSAQTMSGWAAAKLVGGLPTPDGVAGVSPDKADVIAALNGGTGVNGTSALLRADNRGVCERCHNK